MESPLKIKGSNKMPTPGGPLTDERIKELGVIKMNDYLSSGTRPQFWEEYFVKVIMHVSWYITRTRDGHEYAQKSFDINQDVIRILWNRLSEIKKSM